MKRVSLVFALVAVLAAAAPKVALATIDCNFPVTSHSWTGKITSPGVRVRDLTCMDSNVLGTIPGGTVVAIIGEADGWYKIKTADGLKGFVWQDFITVTSTSGLPDFVGTTVPKTTEPVKTEYTKTEYKTDLTLQERVKGKILLQVESHGEAWYVRPDDGKRYYMKDGEAAYQMMRAFGLGISNANLYKLKSGDATLVKQLKGKIVLQVESLGEAYYVHPDTGKLHYLKDGTEAYRIMRELSLGITNDDLLTIADRDFETYLAEFEAKRAMESGEETPAPTPEPSAQPSGAYQDIHGSSFQVGVIPSGVDVVALNEYWLSTINSLRAQRGLRQLVLDQRWVDTASEWAGYMGENDHASHDRPDGKTMHQWIDAKGLDFTVRYSEGGWSGNYFTENISWGYASAGDTESVQQVLDDTLAFFLSEASSNGPHYRTIYHPDWNSVGVGFHFTPDGNGYKVYVAMHYGSLVL